MMSRQSTQIGFTIDWNARAMALPLSVQMSRLCFDVGGEIKTYRNFTIEKLEYARITDARVHRQYSFFLFVYFVCGRERGEPDR